MKSIHIIDENGYKYKTNLKKLSKSNRLPHKFRNNPYAIDNIKTYLIEINSPLTLLSTEYKNCKEKLEFRCKIHNDKTQFKTLDDIITQKGACKFCSFEQIGKRCQISTQIVEQRCSELNLIYVDRFIKNQDTFVKFICPNHVDKGTQEIAWYHLKSSAYGCPYCAGKYKTTEDFKKELSHLMPDITILGEYTGSEGHITCQCNICGHIWSPIARSLKNKEGCPACKMSRGERKIHQYLTNRNLQFEYQKSFLDCSDKSSLLFDFYIDSIRLAIEYDGEQHFFPVDFAGRGRNWAEEQFKKNKFHDELKNQYCLEHNISLLRIPYFEYENIANILNEKLAS